MASRDRSGRTEEERILLKSLHDALNGGQRGGVLQPALSNIKDRSEDIDQLTDEEISRAARKLHRDGIILSEESFRPRPTWNPTIALTPKGWDVLEDMGYTIPDEWFVVFDEILETLYEHEIDRWNTPSSHTWMYRDTLTEKIEADYAVIDHFIEYMLAIRYIVRENDRSANQRIAYEITERGAQAYEDKDTEFENVGFE